MYTEYWYNILALFGAGKLKFAIKSLEIHTALLRGGPFPTIENFNKAHTVIEASLWIYCVTDKRLNFRPHID